MAHAAESMKSLHCVVCLDIGALPWWGCEQCNAVVCDDCMNDIEDQPCPICRQEDGEYIENHALASLAREMNIYVPCRNGCNTQLPIDSLAKHEREECSWRSMEEEDEEEPPAVLQRSRARSNSIPESTDTLKKDNPWAAFYQILFVVLISYGLVSWSVYSSMDSKGRAEVKPAAAAADVPWYTGKSSSVYTSNPTVGTRGSGAGAASGAPWTAGATGSEGHVTVVMVGGGGAGSSSQRKC